MQPAITDAVTNAVRVVLTPYANLIEPQKIDDALAVLLGDKIAVVQDEMKVETPMSIRQAAGLLGCTTTAVQYHIRKGRLRRVAIPGASRSRGLVAADVRAIVAGKPVTAEKGV